jgi:hypothetical protein
MRAQMKQAAHGQRLPQACAPVHDAAPERARGGARLVARA